MKTKTNIYPSALLSSVNRVTQQEEKPFVVFRATERTRSAATRLSNLYAPVQPSYPLHFILLCSFRFALTLMILWIYSKWTLNLGTDLMLRFVTYLLFFFVDQSH